MNDLPPNDSDVDVKLKDYERICNLLILINQRSSTKDYEGWYEDLYNLDRELEQKATVVLNQEETEAHKQLLRSLNHAYETHCKRYNNVLKNRRITKTNFYVDKNFLKYLDLFERSLRMIWYRYYNKNGK